MARPVQVPAGPMRELLARDPLRRRAAARRMASAPESLREPLVTALGDAEEGIREAAAEALATLGDEGAVEALSWALADRSPCVRAACAAALGSLAPAGSAGRLRELLRDESWLVRHAATRALGKSGDPSVVPDVLRAIKASPGISELVAAPALAGLGAAAVEALLQGLDDPDERVREAVIRALGSLDDPRAIDPLVRLAHDGNERVRFLASQAVRRLTSSETM